MVAFGGGDAVDTAAPRVLEAVGCEVIPLDCELDLTFLKLQSEHRRPQDAARDGLTPGKEHKADVALGFDGDGDRCGVVDNDGEEIFADKVGVMLARDISSLQKEANLRGRRKVDRVIHDGPGADREAGRQDRSTGRPAIPT